MFLSAWFPCPNYNRITPYNNYYRESTTTIWSIESSEQSSACSYGWTSCKFNLLLTYRFFHKFFYKVISVSEDKNRKLIDLLYIANPLKYVKWLYITLKRFYIICKKLYYITLVHDQWTSKGQITIWKTVSLIILF